MAINATEQTIEQIIQKVDNDAQLSVEELQSLLEITEHKQLQALYACAYRVKACHVGKVVYLRGLIEASNICQKDCYYCGIRVSNKRVKPFNMSQQQIVEHAVLAYEHGYRSVVIQAGERQNPTFVKHIEGALAQIKQQTQNQLRVTLSLGEQSEQTYQRWFNAGAHRYLLRIETTNPELYQQLHPADHSLQTRIDCLKTLKKVGYQVGTGVMIGLPNQTAKDLVADLLFMQQHGIDMVGMGPYIPHHDTPLGKHTASYDEQQKQQALTYGLKMIAVARILLRDVNIAAATSLHALAPNGRELGVQAGANVIMPNLTDLAYRASYQLYQDKPFINEQTALMNETLNRSISALGEKLEIADWGDSKHYQARVKSKPFHA